jgi:hypothetical protein
VALQPRTVPSAPLSAPASGAGAPRAAQPSTASTPASLGATPPPVDDPDEGLPPLRPEELDEDLRDKDLPVASRIQRRRNRERAKQKALVDAYNTRLDDAAKESSERWKIKDEVTPLLQAWAREPGGGLKDVRAMLLHLPDILWDPTLWTDVTMAKMVQPSKVKLYVRKAQLIVHPDKQRTLGAKEKLIAEFVFDTLQQAWKKFEEANASSL